ncbi:Hypothetical predicted protein [Octopus vulgaris]|uniref:Uncharacterized protein n=1 Tax=Octopus vulgaris TaxID=6645 RepID=A0AA36BD42_OCTVU|nr:Hypothetical predicted protein [Octopus vulgaris]
MYFCVYMCVVKYCFRTSFLNLIPGKVVKNKQTNQTNKDHNNIKKNKTKAVLASLLCVLHICHQTFCSIFLSFTLLNTMKLYERQRECRLIYMPPPTPLTIFFLFD